MSSMKETDKAIIAAWIDTEGCIGTAKSSRDPSRRTLQVTISQKNPTPLKWIQSRVGGSLCKTKRGSYRLQLSARPALKALELGLPYFLGKKDQALLGIELGRRTYGSITKKRQVEIAKQLSILHKKTY